MSKRKVLDRFLNAMLVLVFGTYMFITAFGGSQDDTASSNNEKEFDSLQNIDFQAVDQSLPKQKLPSRRLNFSNAGIGTLAPLRASADDIAYGARVLAHSRCNKLHSRGDIAASSIKSSPTSYDYLSPERQDSMAITNVCLPYGTKYPLFGSGLQQPTTFSVAGIPAMIVSTNPRGDTQAFRQQKVLNKFRWYSHATLMHPWTLRRVSESGVLSYDDIIRMFLPSLSFIAEKRHNIRELIVLVLKGSNPDHVKRVGDVLETLTNVCVTMQKWTPRMEFARPVSLTSQDARCFRDVVLGWPNPDMPDVPLMYSMLRKAAADVVKATRSDDIAVRIEKVLGDANPDGAANNKTSEEGVPFFTLIIMHDVQYEEQLVIKKVVLSTIPSVKQTAMIEMDTFQSLSYLHLFRRPMTRQMVLLGHHADNGFLFALRAGDVVIDICGPNVYRRCSATILESLDNGVHYIQFVAPEGPRKSAHTIRPRHDNHAVNKNGESNADESTTALSNCLRWVDKMSIGFSKMERKLGMRVFVCHFGMMEAGMDFTESTHAYVSPV